MNFIEMNIFIMNTEPIFLLVTLMKSDPSGGCAIFGIPFESFFSVLSLRLRSERDCDFGRDFERSFDSFDL